MIDRIRRRFYDSRLDIRVGLVAAPIAILGLASSVLVGNEDLFGLRFPKQDQSVILIFAIGVFVLTLCKAIMSWK